MKLLRNIFLKKQSVDTENKSHKEIFLAFCNENTKTNKMLIKICIFLIILCFGSMIASAIALNGILFLILAFLSIPVISVALFVGVYSLLKLILVKLGLIGLKKSNIRYVKVAKVLSSIYIFGPVIVILVMIILGMLNRLLFIVTSSFFTVFVIISISLWTFSYKYYKLADNYIKEKENRLHQ